jgi:hypothetical protein
VDSARLPQLKAMDNYYVQKENSSLFIKQNQHECVVEKQLPKKRNEIPISIGIHV